jgi:uncharacterized protein (DUF433 family)
MCERDQANERIWQMSLVIEAPPVPLRVDENGVLRVGQTRVPLDTVVYSFNQGASPEEIVLSYSTLELADVYAVINFYLYNRAEVDAYINGREEEAARIRAENEKRFPQAGIRARLLARRKGQEV